MKLLNEWIKDKRAEKEITLRQFCRDGNFDPSNWSKIERGIIECPKSKEALDKISSALKLNHEDDQVLRDLVLIDGLPKDIKQEDQILENLPLFFRTLRGESPSKEELLKLLEKIKNS